MPAKTPIPDKRDMRVGMAVDLTTPSREERTTAVENTMRTMATMTCLGVQPNRTLSGVLFSERASVPVPSDATPKGPFRD
jgi:hypothetical protein